MSEENTPVAEATTVADEQEIASYELAFHILPTVTEGEVPEVTQTLKALITKAGGTISDEEAPAHFELAYEIEKYLEGKYRRFQTAYFGWVRFSLTPAAIAEVVEAVEGDKHVLRHLCIRLTKAEEANPFRFHEALETRQVRTVDTDEVAPVEAEADTEAEAAPQTDSDTADTMSDDAPKA